MVIDKCVKYLNTLLLAKQYIYNIRAPKLFVQRRKTLVFVSDFRHAKVRCILSIAIMNREKCALSHKFPPPGVITIGLHASIEAKWLLCEGLQ